MKEANKEQALTVMTILKKYSPDDYLLEFRTPTQHREMGRTVPDDCILVVNFEESNLYMPIFIEGCEPADDIDNVLNQEGFSMELGGCFGFIFTCNQPEG